MQELRNCTVARYDELVKIIHSRLEVIEEYIEKCAEIQKGIKNSRYEMTSESYETGALSGRDAANAIAWINWFLGHDKYSQENIKIGPNFDYDLHLHRCGLHAEKEGLHQVLLAAKVMTFVNSPTHKKLMNLTHDWLRTFLPHCLSKVNRVSFGLLTSEECLCALEEDALLPRSRLSLAVPFMGKDVPSKSAGL